MMQDALWQAWWVWVAGGLVLAVLEVVVPGFIFLGFAIGAVLTGLILAFGATGLSAAWLVLIFALASLVAFVALKRAFPGPKGQVKLWDRDINDN